MTVKAKKTKKAAKEPDWDALKDIAKRLDEAVKAGTFDEEMFESLLAEGRKATHGDDDLLEFLYNEADDDW